MKTNHFLTQNSKHKRKQATVSNSQEKKEMIQLEPHKERCMSVTQHLGNERQKNYEFKASLGCIEKSCLKKKKERKKEREGEKRKEGRKEGGKEGRKERKKGRKKERERERERKKRADTFRLLHLQNDLSPYTAVGSNTS
jgi:hypothetical protein